MAATKAVQYQDWVGLRSGVTIREDREARRAPGRRDATGQRGCHQQRGAVESELVSSSRVLVEEKQ